MSYHAHVGDICWHNIAIFCLQLSRLLLTWMTITTQRQNLRFSNSMVFGSSPVAPTLTAWFIMATRRSSDPEPRAAKKIYLVDLRPAWRPRCIGFHLCFQNI